MQIIKRGVLSSAEMFLSDIRICKQIVQIDCAISILYRHTCLGWARKLLTLEMLHIPSRYCCAWMVTVLRDPVSCPPATVTCTLVLDPEEAEGLWAQPGTLCRSPKGRIERFVGWPFTNCLAWTLADEPVILEGCCWVDGVGNAAMSEPKARTGEWSACKASFLSWWRGVEHTWQQSGSWFPGVWSWSKRKVAYPGSCRERNYTS